MTPYLRTKRKRIYTKLFHKMEKLFPVKVTELDYTTPWQLLVAVVLSAQCTDDRVNQVTKKLFKEYPNIENYLTLSQGKLEKLVYSTGFYKNKAKNILAAAQKIYHDHDGIIPSDMKTLVTIPGVGRKTANVVLQNIYNNTEGIAVDTHVLRFAKRYKLTDGNNPESIERDLIEIIPPDERRDAGYYMKQYGRSYGPARGWNKENDPLWVYYQKIKKE